MNIVQGIIGKDQVGDALRVANRTEAGCYLSPPPSPTHQNDNQHYDSMMSVCFARLDKDRKNKLQSLMPELLKAIPLRLLAIYAVNEDAYNEVMAGGCPADVLPKQYLEMIEVIQANNDGKKVDNPGGFNVGQDKDEYLVHAYTEFRFTWNLKASQVGVQYYVSWDGYKDVKTWEPVQKLRGTRISARMMWDKFFMYCCKGPDALFREFPPKKRFLERFDSHIVQEFATKILTIGYRPPSFNEQVQLYELGLRVNQDEESDPDEYVQEKGCFEPDPTTDDLSSSDDDESDENYGPGSSKRVKVAPRNFGIPPDGPLAAKATSPPPPATPMPPPSTSSPPLLPPSTSSPTTPRQLPSTPPDSVSQDPVAGPSGLNFNFLEDVPTVPGQGICDFPGCEVRLPKAKLRQHRNNHPTQQCPTCTRKYSRKSIGAHKKTCEATQLKKQNSYKCKFCEKAWGYNNRKRACEDSHYVTCPCGRNIKFGTWRVHHQACGPFKPYQFEQDKGKE